MLITRRSPPVAREGKGGYARSISSAASSRSARSLEERRGDGDVLISVAALAASRLRAVQILSDPTLSSPVEDATAPFAGQDLLVPPDLVIQLWGQGHMAALAGTIPYRCHGQAGTALEEAEVLLQQ